MKVVYLNINIYSIFICQSATFPSAPRPSGRGPAAFSADFSRGRPPASPKQTIGGLDEFPEHSAGNFRRPGLMEAKLPAIGGAGKSFKPNVSALEMFRSVPSKEKGNLI
ncbi:MAG: hypothetical protein HFI65_09700 [Lachnospiraceae bacterium]|nr:hypothetical protein [Lachnospiraceae bacterium]